MQLTARRKALLGGVYRLSDSHRAQADFLAKGFVGKLVVSRREMGDGEATGRQVIHWGTQSGRAECSKIKAGGLVVTSSITNEAVNELGLEAR
jgi:hypothetical protein